MPCTRRPHHARPMEGLSPADGSTGSSFTRRRRCWWRDYQLPPPSHTPPERRRKQALEQVAAIEFIRNDCRQLVCWTR